MKLPCGKCVYNLLASVCCGNPVSGASLENIYWVVTVRKGLAFREIYYYLYG